MKNQYPKKRRFPGDIHGVRRRQTSFAWMALFGFLAVALAVVAPAGGANPTVWHLADWRYRQEVELVTIDKLQKINTALIEVEAPLELLAKDGRDIRVVDEKGGSIEFHLVDAKGAVVNGPLPEGLRPRVHFLITDVNMRRYYVYYGNPKAPPAWETWAKKLGGLTLETRANTVRRPAKDYRHVRSMIASGRKVFGSGQRRQINDPANPFGPNEYYVGIYDGLIYCPTDGDYAFGTDSDDSSFLLIDGKLVAQWPGGHNPSGRFNHFGRLSLRAGVHRIQYYHVQSGGGALARAGWRPPGASEFALIPEDAFIKELRTRTLLVEDRDSPLSVYFESEILDVFQFGNDGPYVARVAFKDLSRSALSDIVIRTWDFGSGRLEAKANPTETFIGDSTRTLTLRCVDELGYAEEWTRKLRFDAGDLRRVDVDMEVSVNQSLLLKGEPLRLKVKCRNAGKKELKMELVAEIAMPDGTIIDRWRRPLRLPPESWQPTEFHIAQSKGIPFTRGRIVFRLNYMTHPVLTQRLVIYRATDRSAELALKGDKLIDASGNLAVLRLSEETYARTESRLVEKLLGSEPVRILVIDDALAGSGPASYVERFAGQLRADFAHATINWVRVGNREASDRSYTPFQSLVDVARTARETRPDLVILAGSLRDMMRFDSIDRFERKLRALVDCVEAACGADVVLLAPPPVIANPGFGQSYAIAVKRVGLRKNLLVADAYTAFLKAGRRPERWPRTSARKPDDDWRRFYLDPESSTPIYHLAPTQAGQELLAETIWRTLFPDRSVPVVKPATRENREPGTSR